MKFLSELEREPWSCDDSSPAGRGAAFLLLAAAVFFIPLILQKLLVHRISLPDIMLFSAMPGVCAYGFFTAKKIPLRYLQLKEIFKCIGWVMVMMIITGCAAFLWNFLLTVFQIPFENEQFAKGLIREVSGVERVKLFFALCIFTPIIEELFFRRIIYGFFLRFGYGKAFFATALLFSCCHFFIAGLPGLFILGLGFQFGYLKFRNLSAAVLMHSLVNSLAFIAGVMSQ